MPPETTPPVGSSPTTRGTTAFWQWLLDLGAIQGDRTGVGAQWWARQDDPAEVQRALAMANGWFQRTFGRDLLSAAFETGVARGREGHWRTSARPQEFLDDLLPALARGLGTLVQSFENHENYPPPGSPPSTTPDPVAGEPPVEARLKALAQLMVPGIPNELIRIWVEYYTDPEKNPTASPDVATALMRDDARYDTFFPGNKRKDGSLRHTEAGYLATIDAYRAAIRAAGVNPDLFAEQFVQGIEGDISPLELEARVQAQVAGVLAQDARVADIYVQYGFATDHPAILAGAFDPRVGDAIFNQRIDIAQVGAEAAAQGFGIGRRLSTRLAQGGVAAQSARQLFSLASRQLGTLNRLASRQGAGDRDVDIGEFSTGLAGLDRRQSARIRRLQELEASQFGEDIGFTHVLRR